MGLLFIPRSILNVLRDGLLLYPHSAATTFLILFSASFTASNQITLIYATSYKPLERFASSRSDINI